MNAEMQAMAWIALTIFGPTVVIIFLCWLARPKRPRIKKDLYGQEHEGLF